MSQDLPVTAAFSVTQLSLHCMTGTIFSWTLKEPQVPGGQASAGIIIIIAQIIKQIIALFPLSIPKPLTELVESYLDPPFGF